MIEISIIVPAYNAASSIERCLYSVINNFKTISWECIVINDGSKDETKNIVSHIAEKYPSIKLVNIKNAGVSNARNVGIKRSMGKSIMFLDADDYLLGNIEELIKTGLENLKLGITTAYNYDVLTNDTLLPSNVHINATDYYQLIRELTIDTQNLNRCWGILYDSEVIKKNKILFNIDLKIGEDSCFVLDYLENINQLSFINNSIIAYYTNDKSVMNNLKAEGINDNQYCYYHRMRFFQNIHFKLNKKDILSINKIYFNDLINYLKLGAKNYKYTTFCAFYKKYVLNGYGSEIIDSKVSHNQRSFKKILYLIIKSKKILLIQFAFKLYSVIRP